MTDPTRTAVVEAAIRRQIYAHDPWLWIKACVWTVDEVDKMQPIKRFPVAACIKCPRYAGGDEVRYAVTPREEPDDYPEEDGDVFEGGACRVCEGPLLELTYLRLLTRAWQAAGNKGAGYRGSTDPWFVGHPPILAIPKSRRMRISWLMASLHGHLALFQPHALIFLVSEKEEKSAELLDRVEGIYTRLTPAKMTPLTKDVDYTRTQSPPCLELPNGARLYGVAEGATQLRQFTSTAVFCDEIGTWKWPRATYTALQPSIEGGGQITLVGSAYPGFWEELVTGSLTA